MRRILAVAALLAATSCATVSHGAHETIAVDSEPSGAKVVLKCEKFSREAVTPARIVIRRNATDCVTTISKPGFKTKSITVERAPARQYWYNFAPLAALPLGISDNSPLSISSDAGLGLLFSGIVGLSVDALDGAMFRHDPAEIRVVLERD